MILKLMDKFDHEPTEEEIHRIEHNCVFCKHELFLACGTPKIVWGGCCIGYITPKKRVSTRRVAHVDCFVKYCGLVRRTKKGK